MNCWNSAEFATSSRVISSNATQTAVLDRIVVTHVRDLANRSGPYLRILLSLENPLSKKSSTQRIMLILLSYKAFYS